MKEVLYIIGGVVGVIVLLMAGIRLVEIGDLRTTTRIEVRTDPYAANHTFRDNREILVRCSPWYLPVWRSRLFLVGKNPKTGETTFDAEMAKAQAMMDVMIANSCTDEIVTIVRKHP